jgi:uroporphyrinogen decarboxylase
MSFQPNYQNLVDAVCNKKPVRLPLYEHFVSVETIESVLEMKLLHLLKGNKKDKEEYFKHYCRFFKEMTYDTVSYEVGITSILPDGGALMGGKAGPIQSEKDLEIYPWDELPELYWKHATPLFDALVNQLPKGMKAIGGIGNGVFELLQDLVGMEYLGFLMVDEPKTFEKVFVRIGDLMDSIWSTFMTHYREHFAVCRFGDDLGHKTGTMISPTLIREHIIPQYKRVIDLVKKYNHPFLWHSCGKIFDVMDDVIELGIDAKHSNEDAIASFSTWIEKYNDRLGLMGGFDVNILTLNTPEEIKEQVIREGTQFRNNAQGYALGSGNSIPDYIPYENFLAMIEAAKEIRAREEYETVAI